MGDKQAVTRNAGAQKDSRAERATTRPPEVHQSPVMDIPLDAQAELLGLSGLGEAQAIGLMTGLQQAYGNGYVQRMVAGIVMREGDEETVAHTAPATADLLIGDTYGTYVQEAIANGVAAVGTVQIVSLEDARRIWAASYGSTPESMAQFETVNGWADRSQDPWVSYVIETRGNPGTVIHEALHLYSSPAYKAAYGTNVNEGTNEYFTRQITDPLRIARGNYQTECDEVTALAGTATEDVMRSAYFEGNLAGLVSTVDGAVGPDTFANWLVFMRAGDWVGARDTLSGTPAPAPAAP